MELLDESRIQIRIPVKNTRMNNCHDENCIGNELEFQVPRRKESLRHGLQLNDSNRNSNSFPAQPMLTPFLALDKHTTEKPKWGEAENASPTSTLNIKLNQRKSNIVQDDTNQVVKCLDSTTESSLLHYPNQSTSPEEINSEQLRLTDMAGYTPRFPRNDLSEGVGIFKALSVASNHELENQVDVLDDDSLRLPTQIHYNCDFDHMNNSDIHFDNGIDCIGNFMLNRDEIRKPIFSGAENVTCLHTSPCLDEKVDLKLSSVSNIHPVSSSKAQYFEALPDIKCSYNVNADVRMSSKETIQDDASFHTTLKEQPTRAVNEYVTNSDINIGSPGLKRSSSAPPRSSLQSSTFVPEPFPARLRSKNSSFVVKNNVNEGISQIEGITTLSELNLCTKESSTMMTKKCQSSDNNKATSKTCQSTVLVNMDPQRVHTHIDSIGSHVHMPVRTIHTAAFDSKYKEENIIETVTKLVHESQISSSLPKLSKLNVSNIGILDHSISFNSSKIHPLNNISILSRCNYQNGTVRDFKIDKVEESELINVCATIDVVGGGMSLSKPTLMGRKTRSSSVPPRFSSSSPFIQSSSVSLSTKNVINGACVPIISHSRQNDIHSTNISVLGSPTAIPQSLAPTCNSHFSDHNVLKENHNALKSSSFVEEISFQNQTQDNGNRSLSFIYSNLDYQNNGHVSLVHHNISSKSIEESYHQPLNMGAQCSSYRTGKIDSTGFEVIPPCQHEDSSKLKENAIGLVSNLCPHRDVITLFATENRVNEHMANKENNKHEKASPVAFAVKKSVYSGLKVSALGTARRVLRHEHKMSETLDDDISSIDSQCIDQDDVTDTNLGLNYIKQSGRDSTQFDDSGYFSSATTISLEGEGDLSDACLSSDEINDKPKSSLPRTNGPRLVIASKRRSKHFSDNVEEVTLSAIPGDSTTIVLTFKNQRESALMLRSKAVTMRFDSIHMVCVEGNICAVDDKQPSKEFKTLILPQSSCSVNSSPAFSVSPHTLHIEPKSEGALYVTFHPSKEIQGLYSGALKIKYGNKSFVLLLRGEAIEMNDIVGCYKAFGLLRDNECDNTNSCSPLKDSSQTMNGVTVDVTSKSNTEEEKNTIIYKVDQNVKSNLNENNRLKTALFGSQEMAQLNERKYDVKFDTTILSMKTDDATMGVCCSDDLSSDDEATVSLSYNGEILKSFNDNDSSTQPPKSCSIIDSTIMSSNNIRYRFNGLVAWIAKEKQAKERSIDCARSVVSKRSPQKCSKASKSCDAYTQNVKTQMNNFRQEFSVGVVVPERIRLELAYVTEEKASYKRRGHISSQYHLEGFLLITNFSTEGVDIKILASTSILRLCTNKARINARSEFRVKIICDLASALKEVVYDEDETLALLGFLSIATDESDGDTLQKHEVKVCCQACILNISCASRGNLISSACNSHVTNDDNEDGSDFTGVSLSTLMTHGALSRIRPDQSIGTTTMVSYLSRHQHNYKHDELSVSNVITGEGNNPNKLDECLGMQSTSRFSHRTKFQKRSKNVTRSSILSFSNADSEIANISKLKSKDSKRTCGLHYSQSSIKAEHSGVYFKKQTVNFGSVPVSTITRLKLELCNSTDQEVNVYLGDPALPFVLLHNEIKLRAKSYVRIPCRFLPVAKLDFYTAEIIAQTADGIHHTSVTLVGSSF